MSLSESIMLSSFSEKVLGKKSLLSPLLKKDKSNQFINQNKLKLKNYQNRETTESSFFKTRIKLERKKSLLNEKKSVYPHYKSIYIGVDEGLIQPPPIEKPKPANKIKIIKREITFHTERKSISTSPQRTTRSNFNLSDYSIKVNNEGTKKRKINDQNKYKNEIKKLNNWDIQNAYSGSRRNNYKVSSKMQIFLNSIGQSSMKWLNDIKSNPEQFKILSRNAHLKAFFTKIEKEQKAIYLQSMNINKKEFDFDVFEEKNVVNYKSTDSNTEQILGKVDVYREIMREKVKVEEMLFADITEVATKLFELKHRKKELGNQLFDATKEINQINLKIEEIKMEEEIEKQKFLDEMNIGTKKGKSKSKDKKKFLRLSGYNLNEKSNLKNITKKDLKFRQTSYMINHAQTKKRALEEKITNIKIGKQQLECQIKQLNSEIKKIGGKIEMQKIKFNQRLQTLRKYYSDILKKGIDVRREGLSWVVVRLITLKSYISSEIFPIFLNDQQITYILKISYMEFEIKELIKLFKFWQKKQKEMRNKHLNLRKEEELKRKHEELKKKKKENKNNQTFYRSNFAEYIEEIADKHENVIKICVNENREDKYINEILQNLHEKIISYIEGGKEKKENFELYFLPGSLAEFFSKDSLFRQNFDDILYLKKIITEKENELSKAKKEELTKFRKEAQATSGFQRNSKASVSSVEHELVFAALFGNGISI